MLKLIIKLSALSIGLCYATSTSNADVQQSQMPSLSERVNQMISSIYVPSLLSKPSPSLPTSSPSSDSPTPYESPTYGYSSYPTPTTIPQLVYLPPPSIPTAVAPPHPMCYLETGLQPTDIPYPIKSNLHPRAAYPSPFNYDYNYSPVPYPGYPPLTYPSSYPYPYPPIPKPSPYAYPDYPAQVNQQRTPYPPVSNSPPYIPSVPSSHYQSPPPLYSTPYPSPPPPYPSPPPPYPQAVPQPPPFYLPPFYPNHSEMLAQPRYP